MKKYLNNTISIIIPVYNVEKYLTQCLESVTNQTYRDLEILLIDDGSTDLSGKICDDYSKKDSRIKVIHQANSGISAARNTGIKLANGEFICFIDSDDYVDLDFCNKLLNVLKNTNSDIAECLCVKFSDENVPKPNNYNRIKQMSPKQWLTETNLKNVLSSCVVWNKLYKHFTFEGIEFPVGRKFEDEATTYKFAYKANKITRIYDELYFYRQRSESITHNVGKTEIDDKCIALKEKYLFFKEKNELDIAAFSAFKYCVLLISVFNDIKTLFSKEIAQEKYIEVKNLYKKFKHSKNIPLKYKLYIMYFLITNFKI